MRARDISARMRASNRAFTPRDGMRSGKGERELVANVLQVFN